ncbi:hypothetical protein ACJQWK_08452 [Exserohilum turcicum]
MHETRGAAAFTCTVPLPVPLPVPDASKRTTPPCLTTTTRTAPISLPAPRRASLASQPAAFLFMLCCILVNTPTSRPPLYATQRPIRRLPALSNRRLIVNGPALAAHPVVDVQEHAGVVPVLDVQQPRVIGPPLERVLPRRLRNVGLVAICTTRRRLLANRIDNHHLALFVAHRGLRRVAMLALLRRWPLVVHVNHSRALDDTSHRRKRLVAACGTLPVVPCHRPVARHALPAPPM